MTELVFTQMLDDLGGICLANGEELDSVCITITLVNSETITALYKNICIDPGHGHVRIWDDARETYKSIPYESILYLEW